jgi:diguanylate cyclase (GGDEF)-like protein/PAS domain S-box-containing protein
MTKDTLTMDDPQTTILLIEDDSADARLIQDSLAGTGDNSRGENTYNVEWVARLDDALERLDRKGITTILLDLTLPDSQGLEAFDQVFKAAPDALILVLCAAGDEEIARQAVQRGAHDYLVKDHLDAHWLSRTLGYIIRSKTTSHALQNSEARFRAMSDASPLGIFVSDAEGNCVYTNAAYQKISGLSMEQALGTRWSMAIHPEDRERVLADWGATAQSDAPFETEFRFKRPDGSIVWTRVNSATMHAGKHPHGHVQTLEDITARKNAEFVMHAVEEDLFVEKERAQVTLNSIGDAVLTTDLQGNVTYLNVVGETMTGWSRKDAMGKPLADVFKIIDGTTRAVAVNPAHHAIAEDRTVGLAADCVLIRRDGSEAPIEDSAAPIHDREGKVSGAVIVFHDVSQSRSMVQKMAHLAVHDSLTDLPNRVLLTERLSQAIGMANRHRKRGALLYMDLDNFKRVNDTLGHEIGDKLLKLVADRLTACVRATDTVCRQGGDEFVILLAEIEQPQDAAHIAEKLRVELAMPQLIDSHELHTSMSIGISVFPDNGNDVDAVMRNADTAMFYAKEQGRDNHQFYMAGMKSHHENRPPIDG